MSVEEKATNLEDMLREEERGAKVKFSFSFKKITANLVIVNKLDSWDQMSRRSFNKAVISEVITFVIRLLSRWTSFYFKLLILHLLHFQHLTLMSSLKGRSSEIPCPPNALLCPCPCLLSICIFLNCKCILKNALVLQLISTCLSFFACDPIPSQWSAFITYISSASAVSLTYSSLVPLLVNGLINANTLLTSLAPPFYRNLFGTLVALKPIFEELE